MLTQLWGSWNPIWRMLGNDGRGGSCQRKATFSCFPLVFPPSSGSGPASPRAATGEKLVPPATRVSHTCHFATMQKHCQTLIIVLTFFVLFGSSRPSVAWPQCTLGPNKVALPPAPPFTDRNQRKKLLPSLFFTPKHSFQAHFFYEFVVYGLGGYTPSPFTDGFRKQVFDTLPNSIKMQRTSLTEIYNNVLLP